MNCPLCVDKQLVPNYRHGIEIDVCPQCSGVWLDRGELDKLADSPAPGAVAAPPAGANSPDGAKADKRDKKSRKKSLGERLGDVFGEVLDL